MKTQSNYKGLNKINERTNKISTQFQADVKFKKHFSYKSNNKTSWKSTDKRYNRHNEGSTSFINYFM